MPRTCFNAWYSLRRSNTTFCISQSIPHWLSHKRRGILGYNSYATMSSIYTVYSYAAAAKPVWWHKWKHKSKLKAWLSLGCGSDRLLQRQAACWILTLLLLPHCIFVFCLFQHASRHRESSRDERRVGKWRKHVIFVSRYLVSLYKRPNWSWMDGEKW